MLKPSATQIAANKLYLALGLDTPAADIAAALALAGLPTCPDAIEMGYEDAVYDIETAEAMRAAIEAEDWGEPDYFDSRHEPKNYKIIRTP